MDLPGSFITCPTFANSGTRIQPDGTHTANGFVVNEYLPAEYFNWLEWAITANLNQLITNTMTELDGVLTQAGVTPVSGTNTQFASCFTPSAIAYKYVQRDLNGNSQFTVLTMTTSGVGILRAPTTYAFEVGGGIYATDNRQGPMIALDNGTNSNYILFSKSSYNVKVSVGMLGSPEANLSVNMDYATGVHKYYDSTQNAIWLALSPSSGVALQYAPSGYAGTDIWYGTGSHYLTYTTIDGKFYINTTNALGTPYVTVDSANRFIVYGGNITSGDSSFVFVGNGSNGLYAQNPLGTVKSYLVTSTDGTKWGFGRVPTNHFMEIAGNVYTTGGFIQAPTTGLIVQNPIGTVLGYLITNATGLLWGLNRNPTNHAFEVSGNIYSTGSFITAPTKGLYIQSPIGTVKGYMISDATGLLWGVNRTPITYTLEVQGDFYATGALIGSGGNVALAAQNIVSSVSLLTTVTTNTFTSVGTYYIILIPGSAGSAPFVQIYDGVSWQTIASFTAGTGSYIGSVSCIVFSNGTNVRYGFATAGGASANAYKIA